LPNTVNEIEKGQKQHLKVTVVTFSC